MESFFAPLSPRADIREQLESAVRRLESYRDLDDHWAEPPPVTFASAIAEVRRQQERFGEPFRLAVVGEFKAGKSTLINAMLGRPGLVPEGMTPTTGAVVEIWRAADGDEFGQVFAADGATIFRGSLADAGRYADQRSEQGRRINGKGARIRLHVDSDVLHNLVVIDTPGLGANDHDDRVTIESLTLADAAFLVINGLRPGSDESVRLAERLRRSKRRMTAVVTRLDQVPDPETALRGTRDVFADVIEGEPVGVRSPDILTALAALEDADDERLKQQARADLEAAGYDDLRARLHESLITGSAAGQRAVLVLVGLRRTLHELSRNAAAQATLREEVAQSAHTEKSALEKHVNDDFKPKVPFLDAKIEEIAHLHVGDYAADLGKALDVFIDQIADSGLDLGARAAHARFSKSAEARLRAELVTRFKRIFPDEEHVAVAQKRIHRAVSALMELEWQEALAVTRLDGDRTFDASDLFDQVTDQLGRLAIGVAMDGLLVGLLFVPGGALLEIGILLSSVAMGVRVKKKSASRLARIKRQAQVQLAGSQKLLGNALAEHYFEINKNTFNALMARAREQASEHEGAGLAATAEAERWQGAVRMLKRLSDEARQAETEGFAG